MTFSQNRQTDRRQTTDGRGQMADSPTRDQYHSIRITVAHSRHEEVLELFSAFEWYICYPHNGKDGDNEHFHIYVPGDPSSKSEQQRLRDAIKRTIGSGNKHYTVKHPKDNLTKAISYGAKEHTEPYTRGPVDQWITDAPDWIAYEQHAAREPTNKRRKLHTAVYEHNGELLDFGIKVTTYNLTHLALHYYRTKKLTHKSFKQTMRSMVVSRDPLYNFTNLAANPATEFHVHDFLSHLGEVNMEKFEEILFGVADPYDVAPIFRG